jgi:hypothetical protein
MGRMRCVALLMMFVLIGFFPMSGKDDFVGKEVRA